MSSGRPISASLLGRLYIIVALLNRLLFTVCGWNILVSFFEASFWHFTEPEALGFKLVPAVGLLLALLVPGFFFISERVWNFRLKLGWGLALAAFEPFMLFVASLPALDERFGARTVALGIATFVLPFAARFSRPAYKTEAAAELFLAVLVSMCVRWAAHAVNIFYEDWRFTVVLVTLSVFASLAQAAVFHGMRLLEATDSAAMFESAARDDVMTTAETIETPQSEFDIPMSCSVRSETTDSSAMNDFEKQHKEHPSEHHHTSNIYPMLQCTEGGSSDVESCTTKSTVEDACTEVPHHVDQQRRLRRKCSALVVVMAPGVASFCTIFIQFFTSPSQLPRWAGALSDTYSIWVVVVCVVSFFAALPRRHLAFTGDLLTASSSSSSTKLNSSGDSGESGEKTKRLISTQVRAFTFTL